MTELQQKIKAVMLKHLQTKGYPNMSVVQILRELKPMWIAIEDAQLVPTGGSFAAFSQTAEQKATEHMDAEEMLNFFMKGMVG